MGSFGSVYLGLNAITGELMAIKQVELPTGQSANEQRKKSMVNTLEICLIEFLKVFFFLI
jgi:mitogen-activated protein kinase kinase kinase